MQSTSHRLWNSLLVVSTVGMLSLLAGCPTPEPPQAPTVNPPTAPTVTPPEAPAAPTAPTPEAPKLPAP